MVVLALHARFENFEDKAIHINKKKNPLDPSKVVVSLYGSDRDLPGFKPKRLYRYGKYSRLHFMEGKSVSKETTDADMGFRVSLYSPIMGIRPEKTLRIEEIIDEVIDIPVLYVGEGHTMYEDHKVQLKVIRALHERGKKFGIGMEMFQQPYQQSLDDYLSGVTTEKEFLKASEYFKRWKYNYHLYREIIDYAKEKGIPVVALNQKTEIIKAVSKGGLDSLNDEERKQIPPDMDMSDEAYRRRLEGIFYQHGSMSRRMDNFYQAQILWDETMAHQVDDFLKKHPDHQMVVIAGSGHIAYGSGIPKRVHRLNGKQYVTILNAKAGTPLTGLADFVLFPETLQPVIPPKLGILVEKGNRQGVEMLLQRDGGNWKLQQMRLLPDDEARHDGLL